MQLLLSKQSAANEIITMNFDEWWDNIGSGIPPLYNEDQEEHARRVTRLACETAMIAEREECANICQQHKEEIGKTSYRDWPSAHDAAEYCMIEIRQCSKRPRT